VSPNYELYIGECWGVSKLKLTVTVLELSGQILESVDSQIALSINKTAQIWNQQLHIPVVE
jgi:hypothetical protein